MGLEYDFDIVAIAPDEVDPEHGMAAVTGHRAVRASFRNVQAVEALHSASPKIQRIFLESGFSLEPKGHSLPHGVFLSEDTQDRERILKRLFANIRNMGVQGEYCGEFDFWHFLDDVRRARPRANAARKAQDPAPTTPHPRAENKPKRRSVQGRIGFALGLAVVVIVVLRYLASEGTAP
ncbi:hypothetical protein RUE5091_02997 [Ruegeria denitrificans]|uniref:Uncharacterized protein n=1 Tax=Ruegeria denitrificans TaxID=1715692 RepID=A0A0P1IE11_9RHOB|nr:hypothetical protein [Ruegeria denitrificans]CUK07834.1 hypothetical protein RUE5091_02997 [Ruegeria denitrificans]